MSLKHVLDDPLINQLLGSKTGYYVLLTHLEGQLCMIGASKAFRRHIGFKSNEDLIVKRYGMAVYRALSDALQHGHGWTGTIRLDGQWRNVSLWAHGDYALLHESQRCQSQSKQEALPAPVPKGLNDEQEVAHLAHREETTSTPVSGSVLMILNSVGTVTKVNDSLAQFLGQAAEEIRSVDAENLVFRPDVGLFKRLFNSAKFSADTMDGAFRLRNTANQVVCFDWTATPMGSDIWMLGRASKIHLEEALLKSEDRINRILESMDDAFFAVDDGGYISYVNEKGAELLGKPIGNLLGRHVWERAQHLKKTALYTHLNQCKGQHSPSQFQWEDHAKQRWYQVKVYPSQDLISVFLTDISSIKANEHHARHQAMHDSLTGLPNRLALTQTLEELIGSDQILGFKMGLLFIDLDGFKAINDTLGHDCGDDLLVAVAQRLRGVVRSSDIVARLSGDEFVITLPFIPDSDTAYHVGRKVVEAISQKPFELAGKRVYMGASVGMALFPNDSRDVEGLLKNADIAMYQAKQSGKNTVRVFHQDMSADLHARLDLENDLHEAIKEDRLVLYYQPRFDVHGEIKCLEALARLRDLQGRLISPAEFIPIAEETGLIVPMGEVLLRQALMWIKSVNQRLKKPVSVSVNVSGIQLLSGNLPHTVSVLLNELNVPAHWLELELTETVLMQNESHVIDDMNALHAMGVKLSIDDFGTGFSSLAMLQRMPVDLIKLDRSFVAGLPNQYDCVVISRTVLALAQSMGMDVVAEGVETEEQRDFLIDSGFKELQGFGLARPMATEDAQHFVWAQEIADSSVNNALIDAEE